ncbi:MAG: hypothetical protein EOP92_31655, partial [Lysobacteraceae bacterium]
MARSPSLARHAVSIAVALGVALAALTAFGGAVAALGAVLAQPVLALAVSWWRGTRAPVTVPGWRDDALALLLLWSLGFAAAGKLPLWRKDANGQATSNAAAAKPRDHNSNRASASSHQPGTVTGA